MWRYFPIHAWSLLSDKVLTVLLQYKPRSYSPFKWLSLSNLLLWIRCTVGRMSKGRSTLISMAWVGSQSRPHFRECRQRQNPHSTVKLLWSKLNSGLHLMSRGTSFFFHNSTLSYDVYYWSVDVYGESWGGWNISVCQKRTRRENVRKPPNDTMVTMSDCTIMEAFNLFSCVVARAGFKNNSFNFPLNGS